MQIPKIDISEIEEKEFSRSLLQDFFSAYNKYGFGYIINHGIEKTLIEQLFQVSKTISFTAVIRKNASSA